MHRKFVKPKTVLMSPGLVLDHNDCPELPDPIKQKHYRSFVEKVQFAAYWVRFDISYQAAQLARFCVSAGPSHWAALTHLMGYLIHRPSLKLVYRRDAEGGLDGFTDSRIRIGETACRDDRLQAWWFGSIARLFSGVARCKRQWLCLRRKQSTTRHRKWPLRLYTYATSSEICVSDRSTTRRCRKTTPRASNGRITSWGDVSGRSTSISASTSLTRPCKMVTCVCTRSRRTTNSKIC
jgi:hypothetical protein